MDASLGDFIAVGLNASQRSDFSIYHLAAIMVCLALLAVMVFQADSAFFAGFVLFQLAKVTTLPFQAERDAPRPSWIGRLTPRHQAAIVWAIVGFLFFFVVLLFLNPSGFQDRYATWANRVLDWPTVMLGVRLSSQILILAWLVGLRIATAGQRLDARPWMSYLLGAVAMGVAWLLALADHVRVEAL